MSINLISTIVSNTVNNSVTTLLPAGNYRLQELQCNVISLRPTANSAYLLSGTIQSGNNVIETIQVVGQEITALAANTWLTTNIDFSRTFNDPLILTPNSAITFVCGNNVNLTSMTIMINASGFKR